MKTVTIKLKNLKIDHKLSILRKINGWFVSRYRQAYRAGANMPLMIVQAISGGFYRIVSGNHRYTAMILEYGPDHKVDVIVKEFANEREVLEEFVKDNISHGNPLNGVTRREIAHELLKHDANAEDVARLFNVSVFRIETWEGGLKVAVLTRKGKQIDRIIKHEYFPQVEPIPEEQHEIHKDRDRAISVTQLSTQLIRWLKTNSIKPTETNLATLHELYAALRDYLSSQEN